MDKITEVVTNKYAIYNNDCMPVLKSLDENSIHMSIYSPPFGGLYQYSSDDRDLSNSFDYKDFFDHYDYVVGELSRVTMKGRITAVHCCDIPSGNTGNDHLIDFPADVVKLHEKHGFFKVAEHIIWKEPLWVRNRTMCKNLSHMTIVEDGAYAGVATCDKLIMFRKKGENKIPIKHPTGFEYYAGECPIPKEFQRYKNWTGDQKQNKWSHMIWRRYASSIWDDINMGRVLPFQESRDEEDEKHVHPLQLDIIDRAVMLRSNLGEIILTPFMGVGSEVYSAVINGRKGIGIELKPSYFRQAVKNMEMALKDTTYRNNDQESFGF